MKTEREIYLKPLTLREQVAMERGICAGSLVIKEERNIEASAHRTGFDNSEDGTDKDVSFGDITWN